MRLYSGEKSFGAQLIRMNIFIPILMTDFLLYRNPYLFCLHFFTLNEYDSNIS
jgi:hypothetical protein